MHVLGICGSLRSGSYNRKLLLEAQALVGPYDQLEIWEGLTRVEPFDEDDEAVPPSGVNELREAIAASDAVLIATPEYNHSVPGQLKNAIDWASRPRRDCVLDHKPVAVIGASPTPGGAAKSVAEIRKALASAGARVINGELTVAHAHQHLDTEHRLVDPGFCEELAAVLGELDKAVHELPGGEDRMTSKGGLERSRPPVP
jgi:chromate reductase